MAKARTPVARQRWIPGRHGWLLAGMSSAGCSAADWVAGLGWTSQSHRRRAPIPSCSADGVADGGIDSERLTQKALDAGEIAVRIRVARTDVVRVRDDPQLLRLFGGLEQRIRVADRDDLVQVAVGDQHRAGRDLADDVDRPQTAGIDVDD